MSYYEIRVIPAYRPDYFCTQVHTKKDAAIRRAKRILKNPENSAIEVLEVKRMENGALFTTCVLVCAKTLFGKILNKPIEWSHTA